MSVRNHILAECLGTMITTALLSSFTSLLIMLNTIVNHSWVESVASLILTLFDLVILYPFLFRVMFPLVFGEPFTYEWSSLMDEDPSSCYDSDSFKGMLLGFTIHDIMLKVTLIGILSAQLAVYAKESNFRLLILVFTSFSFIMHMICLTVLRKLVVLLTSPPPPTTAAEETDNHNLVYEPLLRL
jgi:hypothetical protein